MDKLKKYKTHYYPHKNAFLKSACGINWEDLFSHSDKLQYVTCKKCLKTVMP